MNKGLTYEESGVSIVAQNLALGRIKEICGETRRAEVIGDIGAFAGLFRISPFNYKDPVLVATCDGVGTKTKYTARFNRYEDIGRDLVGATLNDITAMGAEPLFLLDYIGSFESRPEVIERIVSGIARGCKEANCSLIGGELAEMKGIYAPGDFDLVGFAVGIVSKSGIVDGRSITAGDRVLAVPSSGPHCNGFTLIRKVFEEFTEKEFIEVSEEIGEPLVDALLRPTTVYSKLIMTILEEIELTGLAHISGGGIIDNVARILPQGLSARLRRADIKTPPVFRFIMERGGVSEDEAFRTFNMGVGFVIVCKGEDKEEVLERGKAVGAQICEIGEILEGETGVQIG